MSNIVLGLVSSVVFSQSLNMWQACLINIDSQVYRATTDRAVLDIHLVWLGRVYHQFKTLPTVRTLNHL